MNNYNEEIIFEDIDGSFLGIDFGTTNTVVSCYIDGEIEQIRLEKEKILPSVLYFNENLDIEYGKKAQKKAKLNKGINFIKEFKMEIGTDKYYEIRYTSNTKSEIYDKEKYVFDTNILIEDPFILSAINEKTEIIIPEKVIDELSYREEAVETEYAAMEAQKEIEKNKNKIKFAKSNLEILPDDLEKKSKNSVNDNRVLSVAFLEERYKKDKEKVFLITNDRGLRNKASFSEIEITTLNYGELKARLNDRKLKETVEEKTEIILITPEEATQKLLEYVKEKVEKQLEKVLDKVVITVPASFNQSQIGKIEEAAKKSGFLKVKILKEPVAVGLAYGQEKSEEKVILVYDFGGGTFDASVVKIEKKSLEVLGTIGREIGGKELTYKLLELIYDKLDDETDIDMFEASSDDEYYINNKWILEKEAERAKIELSSLERVEINAPLLMDEEGKFFNFSCIVTRREFEEEIAMEKKENLDLVIKLLESLKLKIEDINEVVLAGGSSLIPSISQSIKERFGKKVRKSIDTSTVISHGAAIEALNSWGGDEEKSIVPHEYRTISLNDFGVKVGIYFEPLIEAGTELPHVSKKTFRLRKDNQKKLIVEVYNRNTLYGNAQRITDKGINYIGKLIIDEIPPNKITDIKVNIKFELNGNDVLKTTVLLEEKNGKILQQKEIDFAEVFDG